VIVAAVPTSSGSPSPPAAQTDHSPPSRTLVAAAAFNAAAVAAATASTPEAFLTDALAQLASLLDVSACAIMIEEEAEPRPAAALGLPAGYVAALRSGEVGSCCMPPTGAGNGGRAHFALGEHAECCDEQLLADGFRSCWSVPLSLVDGRALGMFVAYSRQSAPPTDETLQLSAAFGSVIALGLERLRRESGLAARYHAVVVALTTALDARDDYTGRHSTETSDLADRVGRRLGMTAPELEVLSQVAVLHDVGKLGISTEILLKPGPLEADEEARMREHPLIGERIISGIPGLAEVARAIRSEHERWDGCGYPDGLAGDQIPLVSRVVFACDAWHAMTSDRAYRPAMDDGAARGALRDGAGTQFDPRVAQALLQMLGDHAPPPACSPSESRDRALSEQLSLLAAELGAEDLFVFRKIAERIYSHLGGIGRGAGWAGNIELDSREERHLSASLESGEPICVALERTGRIVGPYYGRSAVLVPSDDETVVVFGSSTDALAGARGERAVALAERARALVIEVSPAKRLADELEVLAAVREITTVNADDVTETLSVIAARARTALSVEYAAVATIPAHGGDALVGCSGSGWEPSDPDAARRALRGFAAACESLPLLCQDLSDVPDAPIGFRHEDGVSSMHVLPIGSPAVAIMLVVHAEPGLRGFTALCQRVAGAMSDAAEVVVRRACAQERLQAENARLAEQVRTDALTGVASRAAWEEALRLQELHYGRNLAPVSVVIVDVDGLKAVNDRVGHAAGDELLRRCARLLADSVRATDMVARIGGDEFGVLLRYSDAEHSQAWSDRLQARLDDDGNGSGIRSLPWSLGCASVPPHETVAAALAEADRRMYEVKLARRAASGRR
jgi:diguanylate cyclase (GGDEF)-like protein